jgi:3-hydroxyisobutyrate dehydrogenase
MKLQNTTALVTGANRGIGRAFVRALLNIGVQKVYLEKAMECLGDLPVLSLAAKGAGSLMVSQNHAPLFPIELVEKDFGYVARTAQSLGVQIPTSAAVMNIYQTAIAEGYGSDNITGIVQLFV